MSARELEQSYMIKSTVQRILENKDIIPNANKCIKFSEWFVGSCNADSNVPARIMRTNQTRFNNNCFFNCNNKLF